LALAAGVLFPNKLVLILTLPQILGFFYGSLSLKQKTLLYELQDCKGVGRVAD